MMPSDEAKLTREHISSINVPNFPSNSENKIEGRPKLEAVVKGRVIRQKKGFLQKFKESICGNEEQSVGDYILYDILIPALKSTISDMVTGGIDMLMFGERRHKPNNVRRDGMKSYVSYSSYYNGSENPRPSSRTVLPSANRHAFEDVIFSSRGEAEDVLSRLSEAIEDYGLVSVADFYDLCNLQSNYTDHKYGWMSLKEAYTERIRDGYIIRLPNARPLN